MNVNMTETEEKQVDMPQSTSDEMDALRSQVASLSDALSEAKQQLTETQKEVAEAGALRTEAENCCLDLRQKVETLSKELASLRGAQEKSVAEVGCQTDSTAAATSKEGTATGSANPSDWTMEVGTSSATQSVADSVRAIAEVATTRTGFVLDKTSGMYYDYNSGYYYDQVNKLYYEPNTGTYYYFDEGSSSYKFHSQVEVPSSAQGPQGKGRGGASGKRKERRQSEEAIADGDRRVANVEDMDCQIIGMDEYTQRHHKRRRKDVSRNHLRISPERSRRAHRERRLKKDHHTLVYGEAGNKVEVVAGECSHHRRRKRMQSRERRREEHRGSQSRRRNRNSKEEVRGQEEGDQNYDQRQQDLETMDVVSDGEIRSDEGEEFDVLEGEGQQSKLDPDSANRSRQQAPEEGIQGNRGLSGGSDERETVEEQKQVKKDEASPETIRGSSEGSTARDDSQSGEEARMDDDKGRGQRSSKEAVVGVADCPVDRPNPHAAARNVRGDDRLGDGRHREVHQEGSEGELMEDVMIVEDGEELIVLSSDGMEEGELSDSLSDVSSSEGSSLESESESSEDDLEEVWVDSDNSGCVEVLKVDYPPCIRMIVTKSDTLKPGSLYIVTCSGGTIGREGNSHVVLIQSVKVSKRHAQIMYDSEDRRYTVVDLGSQNGTLLNGKAISEQRVVSEPHPLSHRDYITIGGTTLRLHIHNGDDTCEECEPGQVQALIALQQTTEASSGMTSSGNKEAQRRKELRHLKKKFNLAKDDYLAQDPSLTNPAYGDRAAERRRTVGSDNPYQPDDQPASVDRAIESTNLGHKLLSKMGWTEGQSLGKGDRGIKEPIQAIVHGRKAGLGSGMAQSIDQVQYSRQRSKNWDKARGRYNLISPAQAGAKADRGKKAPAWVQGGTQTPAASPQATAPGGRVMDVVQLPLAAQGRREKTQAAPPEIVDIWDESMEATSPVPENKSGSFPGGVKEKETGKLLDGDVRSTGDDSAEGQGSAECRSSVVQFAGKKSGKGGAGQSHRTDKPFPDESEAGKTAEDVDDAGQEQEQEELESIGGDGLKLADSAPDEAGVMSEGALESIENMPQSPSPNPHAVEDMKDLTDKTGEPGSGTSQQPNEEPGMPVNGCEAGSSEALEAVPLTPEAAGATGEKGKIQLKWNKGGKERVATHLVAFEESESSEEEEKEEGNSRKGAAPEQSKAQQRKAGKPGIRLGSERPTRWSRAREHSGN